MLRDACLSLEAMRHAHAAPQTPELSLCLWSCASAHADGSLDVVVRPERADWSTLVADLSVTSPGLCRGLFELYLGSSSGAFWRRHSGVQPHG